MSSNRAVITPQIHYKTPSRILPKAHVPSNRPPTQPLLDSAAVPSAQNCIMVSIKFTAVLVALVLACAVQRGDAQISLHCHNYRNIVKEQERWVYWCFGGGRVLAQNRYCDCERAYFFSKARKTCERSETGKRFAKIGLQKCYSEGLQFFKRICKCNGISYSNLGQPVR